MIFLFKQISRSRNFEVIIGAGGGGGASGGKCYSPGGGGGGGTYDGRIGEGGHGGGVNNGAKVDATDGFYGGGGGGGDSNVSIAGKGAFLNSVFWTLFSFCF